MAFFKEQFQSGQGAVRAIGELSETRTIHVRAEESEFTKQQGPTGEIVVPPVPEGLVQFQFAGLGTWHPRNTALRVSGYRRGQRLNEKTWAVDILHKGAGGPDPIPGETGWRVSLKSASISKRLLYPLSANVSRLAHDVTKPGSGGGVTPVPLPTLTPSGAGDGTADVDAPDMIGPTIYEPARVNTPGAAFYYIRINPEEGTSETVYLVPTERRKPVGYQTEVPAVNVVFTKIAARFDFDPMATQIAQFIKAVNHTEFLGADPGHVMVNDVTFDPEEGEMLGQSVPGLLYRVTVSFYWSAELWTPWSIHPTVIADDGAEYVVKHLDGSKVVESFRVRRTQNLYSLLWLLTSGRP